MVDKNKKDQIVKLIRQASFYTKKDNKDYLYCHYKAAIQRFNLSPSEYESAIAQISSALKY